MRALLLLTGREMIENGLAGGLIPGPAIFIETTSVMTPDNLPYRRLSDLADKPICFALGPHAEFHLRAWFEARHLSFVPMGFQEDVEMNDAYAVRYCHGLAGETTTLAATAASVQMARIKQRLLPDTLAAYPILASTATRDGEWAALIGWTLETLKRADAPDSAWTRGGYASLPIAGPALGLDKGWQKRVVDLVGGYGALFEKNLGAGSPLHLDRARLATFTPPYVD